MICLTRLLPILPKCRAMKTQNEGTTSLFLQKRRWRWGLNLDLRMEISKRHENCQIQSTILFWIMTTTRLDTPNGFISKWSQNLKQVIYTILITGTKIKLNIVNLMKPYSLYKEGMKPWVKSEKHMKNKGIGWHRDCADITYEMNTFLRKGKAPSKNIKSEAKLSQYYFYTLSFTYELLYTNDSVYFAHAVPYTYNNDYMSFLHSLKSKRMHTI